MTKVWRNIFVLCFFAIYTKVLGIGISMFHDTIEIEKTNITLNERYYILDMNMLNTTLTKTPFAHDVTLTGTISLEKSIHTKNTTIHVNPHKEPNYKILITIPVGAVLFITLIIVLIFFIKRRIRNRRLQREFLPQYGYDHSEAEIFDGYTQYADVTGSVERLVNDNSRIKTASPDSVNSINKSDISIEVATIPIQNGSTSKAEVHSQEVT